jgi:hypothetical protein
MSGRPAVSSDASLPRLLVQAAGSDEGFDVFDVIAASGNVLQVRSALLFEVGEQLRVRIELSALSPLILDLAASPLGRDGAVATAIARVRAHVGPDDDRITELELSVHPDPGPRRGC